ncbi:hypothetical protein AMK59_2043 [Oryctes borbonicus]|uniref:Odorant binding protein n=1 Tax=Oryctes borbonicus TaxID=1629725 RepID=A0A0T6BA51_9SCAR|nr:hypothetical protein AMK59_2043 [Oryctes borbonicus]
MKRFIVSILLIGIIAMVHAKPSMEKLDQYREACAQEVGISLESVTHPPLSSGPPPEPSKDMKCFMRCVLTKAGIFDSNGALQTSKLHLPEDATNVDLSKCTSITDSDPCQQTYLIEVCIRQQLPKPPSK